MNRSTLLRSLGSDTVFKVAAVVYLAAVVSSFLGIAPVLGEGMGKDFALPVAVLLAIAGIQVGLRRSETATGIAFWNYVSVALGLRLLAIGLEAAGVGGTPPSAVLLDSVHVTENLLLVLAAELRPDLGPVHQPRQRAELWLLISTFVFVLSSFAYCSLIPAWSDPELYLSGRMSTLLDLFLVLFLLMRFAYLGGAATSTRWRWVYRFTFCGLLAIALLLATRLYGLTLDEPQRVAIWERLWIVPALMVFLAARLSRAIPRGEGPRQLGPRVWESLVFYAFALPIFHLLLHYFETSGTKSSSAQEGLVILYFVAMGTFALVQATRREKRRHDTSVALRESERRYRQLIESHPDAILIEQDGSLVYANATAIEKLGLRSTIEDLSLAGLGFCGLEPSAQEPPPRNVLPVDCQLRSGDGEILDFEILYHEASYLGAPAVQAIARDVTETRRLRAEAENTARLATLGKISAAMAHEIRNPLAAIVMHSFYLAERLKKDQDNLQILADINTAVDRMKKLVTGILGFVRPSELQLVEEDLVDVVESGLAALGRQTDYSKVEVVRDYTHQSARVEVDVHQMVTVFLTLFDNAVRAMPDGGTITIRAENPEPTTVEVVVEDTGVGIEAGDLKQIFEPFFTRRDDGIGLGLALVSRVLAQHACQYRVESEPGRGTRFVVSFQLAQALGPAEVAV